MTVEKDAEEGQMGLLVYGFSAEQSAKVKNALESIVGKEIIMYSATGKDETTIHDILSQGPVGQYAEAAIKFLMFLGFAEEQVRSALTGYPAEVPRPIFCALTPSNLEWPVKELIAHLLEEQIAMMKAEKEAEESSETQEEPTEQD